MGRPVMHGASSFYRKGGAAAPVHAAAPVFAASIARHGQATPTQMTRRGTCPSVVVTS